MNIIYIIRIHMNLQLHNLYQLQIYKYFFFHISELSIIQCSSKRSGGPTLGSQPPATGQGPRARGQRPGARGQGEMASQSRRYSLPQSGWQDCVVEGTSSSQGLTPETIRWLVMSREVYKNVGWQYVVRGSSLRWMEVERLMLRERLKERVRERAT